MNVYFGMLENYPDIPSQVVILSFDPVFFAFTSEVGAPVC